MASVVLFVGLLLMVASRKREQRMKDQVANNSNKCRFIFLGTGCSTGTPTPLCLLGLIPGRPHNGCEVCQSAHAQLYHPNRRGNPSVLVQNPTRTTNLLIDCGKTFRESVFKWFPLYDIRGIHHILLTHEHADAVFGLDEIRTVQRISRRTDMGKSLYEQNGKIESLDSKKYSEARHAEVSSIIAKAIQNRHAPVDTPNYPLATENVKPHPLAGAYENVPVYCIPRTQKVVVNSFPYLFSKPTDKPDVPRFVSKLEVHPFDLDLSKPFAIPNFFEEEGSTRDLQVTPLPVEHGADFLSSGFQFGRDKQVFVYISDVSRILPETMLHLQNIKPRIDVFVLDCLRPINTEKESRPMVHFDLEDVLNTLRQFSAPPKQTYLVGMGHEFDHHATNELLSTLPESVFGKVALPLEGLALELEV